MAGLADIDVFLERATGVNRAARSPDADLETDLGITGDDFSELMEAFSKQFGVDMQAYLWYFHHQEEAGFNPGGTFFPPPSRQVQRIPVTPNLLLKAVNSGRWPVKYPEHTLPKYRYDLLLNQVILAIVVLAMAIVLLRSTG